jgi:hypothetical protein
VPQIQTTDFLAILEALQRGKVDFIVIGGVAAVLHGAPINTFDLDVIHARNPANVGRLLTALATLDAHARGRPNLRPDATHLVSPGHQLLMTRFGPLDVLGSVGAKRTYEDLVPFAVAMPVAPNLTVRVLRLDWLIRLKEETGGEKDRAVLPILRRTLEEKS